MTYRVIKATRLECTTNGHNKYYEIAILTDGLCYRLFTRYGKISVDKGAGGTLDSCYDLAEATYKFDKLHNEKTRKKYVSVFHLSQPNIIDVDDTKVPLGEFNVLRIMPNGEEILKKIRSEANAKNSKPKTSKAGSRALKAWDSDGSWDLLS